MLPLDTTARPLRARTSNAPSLDVPITCRRNVNRREYALAIARLIQPARREIPIWEDAQI